MGPVRRTHIVTIACVWSLFLARPSQAAEPQIDACATRAELLGVSRIVEIDTGTAPKFGHQYGGASFLEDGEVVLTFDDGPLRPYTKRVLDALDQQCTKATFFIVGRMAIADPELLKETQRRGHTIGIHTYSHAKLSTVGAATANDDIEYGLSAIAKALGATPAPFFRFPYLRDTRATLAHLEERKIGVFGIDVDSRDFSTRNPAAVQRTILDQLSVARKGIILMHDIQPSTAGAIRSLLSELKKRGFKVVHMVSANPSTTLAEYDAKAAKQLESKTAAAVKSPLATRSVVWSAGTKTGAGAPAPEGGQLDEDLPWLQKQPAPASKPTSQRPPRRPEPPGMASDPWQIRAIVP